MPADRDPARLPRRAHLIALEPRMMFDAAAVAVVADLADDSSAHPGPDFGRDHDRAPLAHVPVTADREAARPANGSDAPSVGTGHDWREAVVADDSAPRDIVFIDTGVADYRQLAQEWAGRGQVVLIDGTRDGIAQMRATLAGDAGIGAIHIVSHGTQAAFWLGTTRVDQAAIAGSLAASLGEIGAALRPGGDILIYGCDFAGGSDGAAALSAFARATHADVAASTDRTGYAGRGGDWTLEASRGAIEARSLDGGGWVHTLDPNDPVPIAVTQDSLTVTDAGGTIIVDGATGYGGDARSPDVGLGAVAVWHGAATFGGQSVDLRATVVSLSAGDAVRFNRPTGTGLSGDDPTFLLRDLTGANDAAVTIKWELVSAATGLPLPADVRFTIADIDGVGGNPNTREGVTADTAGLAYFTRERVSDINFVASLNAVTASGTQNENTVANQPLTPKSAATFDWSATSGWTLTYKLTTNAVTTQAQFFHDGDADFLYTDPVYVSIPRLDLDGNNSSAPGNDARFTFTEGGLAVAVVDADLVVSNPMDINSITGATVRLTNWRTGDTLAVGALPSNITASIGPVTGGAVTLTLSGLGSEADYTAALKAVRFANGSDRPDPTQRVIEVSFSNDTLTSAIATSRIDVIPVNDAPVAANDSAVTRHDTPVTIAVLANDTDPEGDALTVTAATAAHGTVGINPNGTITYTPNAGYSGADTINYQISDGNGGTSAAIVAVTVTPNTPPAAVGTLPARLTLDAATVSFATATGFGDADGDALTYSATGLPAGLFINGVTGVISGTVNRSASQVGGGNYTVAVTARDPSNASATQSFSLRVTNPAPTAADDAATTAEDVPVTINVLGNDSDPDGDPLSVTAATALHGSVVRNAGGTLTYTPNPNYTGTDTITYSISDGQGGTATARVAVTVTPVNDAPVPVGTLPPRTTLDGAAVSYATAGAFADVDGDALTYTASGLPAGLSIDAATGVVSGTLSRSASQANGGNYAVTVTATDPSGAAATRNFTIAVANPAPVAADDGVTTHVDTPVTIPVLGNDADPDGDPLAVIATGPAAHGTVAINADGTVTYTPDAGYAGSDSFAYTITDGQGGTASAVVTIGISNAAPAAAPLAPVAARDGDTVSIPAGASFADADGDPLTFTVTGLPDGLLIDAVTGTITGTIDRRASQVNGGRYDSIVTAADGHGGTTSAALHWDVSNAAPVAADDGATTPEDQPIVIVVLGNDGDPDGDPLTVTSATAQHGTVLVNADGSITYTPAPDFTGVDQISYTIADGDGGEATAIVQVTVTPVNDAPASAGLPPRISSDGAGVLLPVGPAFGDVDGDTLTWSATGLPFGLSIDPATGVISGTIAPGSVRGGAAGDGVYTVVVTATDPSGASVAAAFSWTVAQAAPVARDDVATTAEDTPVTIPVLDNDSDDDLDPLTIVDATASSGTVAIAGGALVFTPAPDANGDVTIWYTIADPAGNRASATVLVRVTPVADAPVASPLPAARAADADPITLDVGGFFRDPDGDPLTFAATGLPAGLAIDPATGRIAGTLDSAASQVAGGIYRVTVTATDPSGRTASSSFDWTIVDPTPVATNDAASVAEDGAVVIPVLANDRDPNGDALRVVSASAGHGSVTIRADGQIVYRPAADYAGNDVIVYTITDGEGRTATASVLVTVTPVNDAPVATVPAPAARFAVDGAPLAIDAAAWFGDVDGDRLTYTAAGLPAGLTIDPATGAIRGTLDRSASQQRGGIHSVTVTARDPGGATAAVTVEIRVTNPAPVAADDRATARQNGAGIVIPVLANDRDPDGDPLQVVGAEADHGTVSINPDGTVVYRPGAGFAGTDTIRYRIGDGEGGTATATVTVMVEPSNRPPVAGSPAPVDAIGGQPVRIAVLPAASDADGDPLTVIGATTATGTVVVNPDGTLGYTPPLGFAGTTTITYTVSDGRGGTTTGAVVVRVADGRGADIEQLLRIGRVTFRDPPATLAVVRVADGTIRNPLTLFDTVTAIRSLRPTTIGERPVGDAVEAIRTLRGTTVGAAAPILGEIDRLERLRDRRDAGDRLFDPRWSDFAAKPPSGFSATADRGAGVMVESVARDGALYLEVRDISDEGSRAPIRAVAVQLANGLPVPDWIKVDPRGLAIIERPADADELHLVVRVTRTDGRTSTTPIVVQGATGEIELDRPAAGHADTPAGRPLDRTLTTSSAAIRSEATRLADLFQ